MRITENYRLSYERSAMSFPAKFQNPFVLHVSHVVCTRHVDNRNFSRGT